ncbi:MAG: hypothetical protein UW39_C0026G0014 [Parcubacteria group bacterium GW2011_GWC2_44_17]|uniref:Squalene cyclase C-terminal domain-containing protein n=1 Tax=Candidatus Jacksonbacteria bacterium RIFCSPLOWO2_02_FULL_44_20 TaxID=1798460 RepID=A0A1G2AAR3_9BACT|nr:MAG: hypothetical protein UW39_C0026G0014 [Parcubacteria group bacterium GW2011_GWC2_44_17]KKT48419.1 MAG: hypothetical protein UW40_C0044G0005 [Parcubacteria group bacterium GW2011_GWF2_44_17]OGY71999.1 MAG: hypothetical protein A3C00_03700 [Candidatus Jacksonbacteria bacterium RIFCSPHIGHO2_02_FULL_44_25]OGY72885.1 MAG: hypothetical protein A3H07_02855 [Candidatus Jacksonbacteria bacterium RIFCSPLOWO2_12_FULL_44_15b]OGY73120.1 MAG: hypothetical protein A3H61_02835 [Candidatus Jacksonbacteri
MRRQSHLAFFAIIAIATGLVTPLRAAPSKNQLASLYLRNAPQNYWSTQALYVLGEEDIAEDHLKEAKCDFAIACAGPILGIAALGRDPRSFAKEDLVAKLLSFSANNQLGDPQTLNDDIFGILALIAAGVSADDSAILQSKTFILNNQNSDGGFGFMIGSSDVDDTAMAVMAMLEAGVSLGDTAIQNAVSYIKLSQNADGGFPFDPLSPYGTNSNADTTAWVVSMLYKLGEDPESAAWSKVGNTPIAFLQSLQTPDGWFESEKNVENAFKVNTTSYTAIALAGASYPVRKIVYTPPAPPPPPPPPAGMIIPPTFTNSPAIPEDTSEERDTEDNEDKKEPEPLPEEPSATAVLGQKLVAPFTDGTLVKQENDPTVYMIEHGRKRWIPNETILGLRFPSPRRIEFASRENLDSYPEGLEIGYPDEVYLTIEAGKKIFLISRGKKYHLRSGETWTRIRARGDAVVVAVGEAELSHYETGGIVE